jgi:hypothetical protein
MKDEFICCLNCKKFKADEKYPGTGWCPERKGVRLETDFP